jgi:polyphosphate kinase
MTSLFSADEHHFGDAAPSASIVGLKDVWIHRDLSWMDFQQRVLAQAADDRTPLLERLKFLAIFTSNLDEFFMKRIAAIGERRTRARRELMRRLRERLDPMLVQQASCFEALQPVLRAHGVHLCRWDELAAEQKRELDQYFDDQISAAITPLVVDPSRPFPFVSNLSLSLGFRLHDPRDGEETFVRVKVPPELDPWLRVRTGGPGEHVFVRLAEVIRENAHKLYPGMELSGATLFRLTRDAEVDVDDEDLTVREAVEMQVRQRRLEPAVRLEFARGADPELRTALMDRFQLTALDTYDLDAELDFTSLFGIARLDVPQLRDPEWRGVTPPALVGERGAIFAAIQSNDILLHHPYESFETSVERFVTEAADDPATVSIKMTVYRVGDDTPFVQALVRAAGAGKQVACVIELQARFDEARNLLWAAELEKAGAQVVFGVLALKIHAKTALVVRKEPQGLRCYAHIGTGNYHVRTARLYTDIGLLTCRPGITREVVRLFHHLTGRSTVPAFEHLLVAPTTMRDRFAALIDRERAHAEAGRPSRIVAKMNQLEDPDLIAALCQASRAGVSIDLLVRGFCCLRPGVPGWSEKVRIRSIVGRFLEHSRIFYFANGSDDPLEGDYYIGSGDWMYRNLSRRIEVAVPIDTRSGKERLWEILDVGLRDGRQAWVLGSDGTYSPPLVADAASEGPEVIGTHETLMRRTRLRFES